MDVSWGYGVRVRVRVKAKVSVRVRVRLRIWVRVRVRVRVWATPSTPLHTSLYQLQLTEFVSLIWQGGR